MKFLEELLRILGPSELKKSKKSKGFPVLKLPIVVLEMVLKQLDPVERFKFSVLSKHTNHLCIKYTSKGSDRIIGITWPPGLSILCEDEKLVTFGFQEKSNRTNSIMDQNVDSNATCHSKGGEDYVVYSENPLEQAMKWAKHFNDIFQFNHILVQINLSEMVDDFFEIYKTLMGPRVTHLKLSGTSADCGQLLELLTSVQIEVLLIRTSISGNLNDFKNFPYRLPVLRWEKPDGITIENILNMDCDFSDLRDSKFTDEELNMIFHEWRSSGNNVKLKSLSIKRNYIRENVNYDVIYQGMENENQDLMLKRIFVWRNEAGNECELILQGGFDVTRDDGKTLTCFTMVPRDQDLEDLNWHSINFHKIMSPDLWKRLKEHFIKPSKPELFKKSSVPTFPVLKLPTLVVDIVVAHLEPTERFNFSNQSKYTAILCKRTIPKDQKLSLMFSYPPALSIMYNAREAVIFNFYSKSIRTDKDQMLGLVVNQTVNKKSECVFNLSANPNCPDVYHVFCKKPVKEQFEWAKHLGTFYHFDNNQLKVSFWKMDKKFKTFVETFKTTFDSTTFQLIIGADCVFQKPLEHVFDKLIVQHGTWILPLMTLKLRTPRLHFYRLDVSTNIDIKDIRRMNSDYIDLRNSTIDDEDLNEMLVEWKNGQLENLKSLSIRRNYSYDAVAFNALFVDFLSLPKPTWGSARYFDWFDDDGKETKIQINIAYDCVREDGKVLTTFFQMPPDDEEQTWHSLNFRVTTPNV
ncbi:Protein CBG27336 [Caenorhabditis briggsae]|uniref:Protein CBG27336 n=1 Tax=Caenorhabditis briggsae TaxID=6238 RepID=B6IE95_CAEBR|nr:Protein CBG27336 [Caenorhabditis briggsae]CAS01159.1 Protein CBG27336 [Caenorhabditis briggsae]